MKALSHTGALLLGSILCACTSHGASGGAATLQVYQSDKSAQCETPGMPLEVMAQQLTEAGIPVRCAQQAHDGRMRAAQCGMPTGRINVFTIPAAKRAQAEQLGFRAIDTLPGVEIPPCS